MGASVQHETPDTGGGALVSIGTHLTRLTSICLLAFSRLIYTCFIGTVATILSLLGRAFRPARLSSSRTMAASAAAASANTIELAQTGKRDEIRELERKYQARWEAEKLFEVNAPSADEIKGLSPAQVRERYPKWFGNFPFPYMNGSLHLGHAFTVSKIEFAAGFQRMLGKRVLFPHGFHCTGMPIKVRCPGRADVDE